MKKLYFLFFFTIGLLAKAQIINFPDPNFKARLLSASPTNSIAKNISGISVKIDTNNDNEIQVSEAQLIFYLNLSSSNITDLTGINNFSNLLTLDCQTNVISILDVSSLTNLQSLICNGCSINSINVQGLSNLTFFNCGFNNLNSLNLSGLIGLESLFCGNNSISSLDLSGLSNLQVLNFQLCQISNINLSGLVNLQSLYCGSNLLTTLDLSVVPNLNYLSCPLNQISLLNLNGLTNLSYLNCSGNQISTLDLNETINLQSLYCYSNQLIALDFSQLTNIIYIYCQNNLLESLNIKNGVNEDLFNIDFSNNSNLNYICVDELQINNIQTQINNYGYTNCHINSYCSFTPNGTFYEISSNTKFDLNTNGCDVSDINYSNLKFNITDGINSGLIIANQTGNYYIPVSAGNHTITPNLENPSYFNISPTSFTVDFPTQTSPFTQDFCVTPNGVKSDVEVVLLPTTPARPGFDANYKLVYRNKGNQVENGNITLAFDDSRLDYVVANPVYNSSATNSFTWNYTNLQPFESREIALVLNVNSPMETPAVNNGDILNYTATISTANTDETQTDNTFTLDQTVVGSYDPNDKKCLQGTTITPTEVGKYVHYVIRFENTGTFPAENIVVKDMIDLAKFDIATLVPLKSSHDFFTRINGNKVEFIFENINLDFNNATNDGYVVFKIKTKPTLVVGNTFTNNANIYFDYNFPITTNTYTTTVAALSAQDFDFGTYFTLYPNPAKDVLNIQTKQSLAINSVEIYNQLGQIVMATTNAINSVDVTNLASGTYFVKVNTEKGSANAKFVKE